MLAGSLWLVTASRDGPRSTARGRYPGCLQRTSWRRQKFQVDGLDMSPWGFTQLQLVGHQLLAIWFRGNCWLRTKYQEVLVQGVTIKLYKIIREFICNHQNISILTMTHQNQHRHGDFHWVGPRQGPNEEDKQRQWLLSDPQAGPCLWLVVVSSQPLEGLRDGWMLARSSKEPGLSTYKHCRREGTKGRQGRPKSLSPFYTSNNKNPQNGAR